MRRHRGTRHQRTGGDHHAPLRHLPQRILHRMDTGKQRGYPERTARHQHPQDGENRQTPRGMGVLRPQPLRTAPGAHQQRHPTAIHDCGTTQEKRA